MKRTQPGDGPVSQSMTLSFEAFYHGTSPRLLRFAYGLTGDKAQAEDFVQEAYIRAWQRWKRLQDYENPESWLRLVVTRLATDRWRWLGLRRNAPRPRAESVPGPSETLTDLIAHLKLLPLDQRRALVLHYFLDQPVSQIAEETGTNVNTVKSWLVRGREGLATHLRAELSDAITPNTETITKRATRRRVTQTIVAFFATVSAAAAALLLFTPADPQPPFNPAPVVPYDSATTRLGVVVVSDAKQAYTLWRSMEGATWVSAIDLATEKLAWGPVDLGAAGHAFRLVGATGGAVVIEGIESTPAPEGAIEPERGVIVALAADTGRQLWRRDTSSPSVRTAPGIVLSYNSDQLEGLDPRTGNPVWQARALVVALDGDRVVTFSSDKPLLQVRETVTGKIRTEREFARGFMGESFLDGDWLYYGMAETLERISVTGSQDPVRLDASYGSGLARCGDQLCARSDNELVRLDRATGAVLWRRPAGPGIMDASDGGIIVNRRGPTGTGADPFQLMVYDLSGNDITPANLSTRDAAWIDSAHLVMRARYEDSELKVPPGQHYTLLALTIISIETGQETLLGRRALLGECGSAQGLYICPEHDGFMIHKY